MMMVREVFHGGCKRPSGPRLLSATDGMFTGTETVASTLEALRSVRASVFFFTNQFVVLIPSGII